MLIDQMIKEVLLACFTLAVSFNTDVTHVKLLIFLDQKTAGFFTFLFTINSTSTLNGNVIFPKPKQPVFLYHIISIRQLSKHSWRHLWISLFVTSLNQAKQQRLHEGLMSLYFSYTVLYVSQGDGDGRWTLLFILSTSPCPPFFFFISDIKLLNWSASDFWHPWWKITPNNSLTPTASSNQLLFLFGFFQTLGWRKYTGAENEVEMNLFDLIYLNKFFHHGLIQYE